MFASQNGHTCKPTALAALDAYFSQKYGVRNIPLRKSLAGGSGSSAGERLTSVRQIAKANGSVQGEILQADMFVRVAEQMGYEARPHNPTDIHDFRRIIINNISNGKPLVTFFPLDVQTCLPSIIFDGLNEHAALIVGYDQKRDTVDISHYQNLYKSIPMRQLYQSMQKLPSTREQEIYKSTGNRVSSRRGAYSLVNAPYDDGSNFLHSIVPKLGSGFKNTLFIVAPDSAHDRWRGSRRVIV
ncbi:MAG: C39 family peptidase [Burkholderiales bacterium]|nr:C39 family peptidase [Burkholderiales bacterium]